VHLCFELRLYSATIMSAGPLLYAKKDVQNVTLL